MRLLIVWIINALSLLALPYLFDSIRVDGFYTALIVALVLGLINAVVRPVLVLLTLPLTIVTIGLFIFVINGLLFWFVASFVKGFVVAGFWPAVFGATMLTERSTVWPGATLVGRGIVGLAPKLSPKVKTKL